MTIVPSTQPVRADLYQRVTDEIIRAVEAGAGNAVMPWHGIFGRPRNAFTGDAYQGINTLALWAAARNKTFSSWYWATFHQWKGLGASVRKGERATSVVLYKRVPVTAEDVKTGEPVDDYRLIARLYFVFNASQVDGWAEPDRGLGQAIVSHTEIDNFITATGADIRTGESPAYLRASDWISMPDRSRFVGTETMPVTESYYATIFHELVHWTGHWSRLDRNLSGRFGTHDYAMEELVAELGAAYLCAEFFVLHLPRKDHAAYVSDWLNVLKADKRAIFTASSHAIKAVEFLLSP